MQYTITDEKAFLLSEIELKLYINENLHKKGFISNEVFEKVRDVILKKGHEKGLFET